MAGQITINHVYRSYWSSISYRFSGNGRRHGLLKDRREFSGRPMTAQSND